MKKKSLYYSENFLYILFFIYLFNGKYFNLKILIREN